MIMIKKILAGLLILGLFVPAICNAADVSLAWDANTESDLAGYTVYYGTASGVYDNSAPVGNVTEFTVVDLPDNTHYFAATAVDQQGNESGYSNEVSTIIDTQPPAAPSGFRIVEVLVR
jgi:fibronectin type 3 domain-containing protein